MKVNHNIKNFYQVIVINANDQLDRYISQANTIKNLQKEIAKHKQNTIILSKLQNELRDLKSSMVLSDKKDGLVISSTLYFKNLTDFTQVWINLDKKDEKINGLIFNNAAAGIVKLENNNPIALLNQNENCNYGVFIGKEKAIGITHGIYNSKNIVVKFIPSWYNIKVGDEVVTNGLDNIFFEGLKVGKVISIKQNSNNLEAIVKPYNEPVVQQFYYIYNMFTK